MKKKSTLLKGGRRVSVHLSSRVVLLLVETGQKECFRGKGFARVWQTTEYYKAGVRDSPSKVAAT